MDTLTDYDMMAVGGLPTWTSEGLPIGHLVLVPGAVVELTVHPDDDYLSYTWEAPLRGALTGTTYDASTRQVTLHIHMVETFEDHQWVGEQTITCDLTDPILVGPPAPKWARP